MHNHATVVVAMVVDVLFPNTELIVQGARSGEVHVAIDRFHCLPMLTANSPFPPHSAVLKVVRNPICTLADRESFDECLRELMKSCDYDLKNPSEETENKQPLIIQ